MEVTRRSVGVEDKEQRRSDVNRGVISPLRDTVYTTPVKVEAEGEATREAESQWRRLGEDEREGLVDEAVVVGRSGFAEWWMRVVAAQLLEVLEVAVEYAGGWDHTVEDVGVLLPHASEGVLATEVPASSPLHQRLRTMAEYVERRLRRRSAMAERELEWAARTAFDVAAVELVQRFRADDLDFAGPVRGTDERRSVGPSSDTGPGPATDQALSLALLRGDVAALMRARGRQIPQWLPNPTPSLATRRTRELDLEVVADGVADSLLRAFAPAGLAAPETWTATFRGSWELRLDGTRSYEEANCYPPCACSPNFSHPFALSPSTLRILLHIFRFSFPFSLRPSSRQRFTILRCSAVQATPPSASSSSSAHGRQTGEGSSCGSCSLCARQQMRTTRRPAEPLWQHTAGLPQSTCSDRRAIPNAPTATLSIAGTTHSGSIRYHPCFSASHPARSRLSATVPTPHPFANTPRVLSDCSCAKRAPNIPLLSCACVQSKRRVCDAVLSGGQAG